MKKVLILCEGQTEETLVRNILAPHLLRRQIQAIPTLLVTQKAKSGPTFKGGITSYRRLRNDVIGLLHDSSAVLVTTLIDYYGLPKDFPGKSSLQEQTPYAKVTHLEDEFARDIQHPRFKPYLMLHEFEALLFTSPDEIWKIFSQKPPKEFLKSIAHFSSPEEINEGANTHPAARIQQNLRLYRKALHGPVIVARIGLETIRAKCPHFNHWVQALEAL